MDETGMPEKRDTGNSDQDILAEVKKRFMMCTSADGDNHTEALNDLRFLKGEQWPDKQRQVREIEGRPCLTINKLPTYLQQITNEQRQNRASIKVSAVGAASNAKTAEVIQGMVRHIEYDSAADIAYDTAGNSAAAIGFGYFRFTTEYESPDSFNQVIKIKRIRNPFTVYLDPASTEPDGSDSQFVIISEKMSKSEFKIKYPGAEITTQGFDTVSIGDSQRTNEHWMWDDQVRVAEYIRIERVRAKLYRFRDGTTGWNDHKNPENPVVSERWSEKRKTMSYLVTPLEVIDSTEIMCEWIPVFPVYGAEIDIDGKVYRNGVIRNAKDPAMMYNFWMTSATEEVSLRPKTPYIGAVGQFEGQSKKWAQANNRSYPYLEYNPISLDGQLAPPPSRQPMVDVPVGVLTMANHASDNIKSTTGLFDSSIGAAGNATSGKQELAQQRQGNITNFHFTDNFYRTLRHAGRCLVKMIPHYYDTDRIILARGEDDSVVSHRINGYDEATAQYVNDIRVGQYDAVVSVGPSYATMRAEAADAMVQFGQSWPKLMDIAGDKVVKAMNWPGADEIAARISRTIPISIKNDPSEELNPEEKLVQLTQQLEEMNTELEETKKKADVNYAKVTAAEITKEGTVEVAKIAADSREEVAALMARSREEVAVLVAENKQDVEELSGSVKILIAKMGAAEAAAADAAEMARADAEARAEAARAAEEEARAPKPEPEPSRTEVLLGNLIEVLSVPKDTPPVPSRKARKVSIKAPSGMTYEGRIEDDDN